eukprot:TRINITY_DN93794_c0_g1_i1.p2 TRINITY_DN93794_c0_g1~~TRINITY_DN93794_c0_g1_i1.p2  ORF type:complete len:253 (-),score=110.69 TRINITY_DN93794_c0_g1_i1:36-794(-)
MLRRGGIRSRLIQRITVTMSKRKEESTQSWWEAKWIRDNKKPSWKREEKDQQHEKNMAIVADKVPGFFDKVKTAYVPLCGDGPIVKFLLDKGIHVTGNELAPSGVEMLQAQFPDVEFKQETTERGTRHVSTDERVPLVIEQCDFFDFKPEQAFDFIYDRGSLVAIPVEQREAYAEIVRTALKSGGWIFLDVFEKSDEPDILDKGPPFHVSDDDLDKFYLGRQGYALVHRWHSDPVGGPFGKAYLKRFVIHKQ